MGPIRKVGIAVDAVQAAASAFAAEIQGLRSVLVGIAVALVALVALAVFR